MIDDLNPNTDPALIRWGIEQQLGLQNSFPMLYASVQNSAQGQSMKDTEPVMPALTFRQALADWFWSIW